MPLFVHFVMQMQIKWLYFCDCFWFIRVIKKYKNIEIQALENDGALRKD